jgi:hypothetical protein
MSKCSKDLNLRYDISVEVNGSTEPHRIEVQEDKSQLKENGNGVISFIVTGIDSISSSYQNSDINIKFNIRDAIFTPKREIHGTDISPYQFEGRFIFGDNLVYNEDGYFNNIEPTDFSTVGGQISIAKINPERDQATVYVNEAGTLEKTSLSNDFWFSVDGGNSATRYSVQPNYSRKEDLDNWKANKEKGQEGKCKSGRRVNNLEFINRDMSKFPVKPKSNLKSFSGKETNPNIKYTDIKGIRIDTYTGKFGCKKNGDRESKDKVIEFRSIQLNDNKLYTFNIPLDDTVRSTAYFTFRGPYYDRIFTPSSLALWKTGKSGNTNCGSFSDFSYYTYKYTIGRKAMDLSNDFFYDSVDYVSCISEYQYENTDVNFMMPAEIPNYEPYTPSLFETWADNSFPGKVNIYNQRLDMGRMEDLKINNNRVAQKGDVVTTYPTSSRHSMSEKWMKRNWLSASAAPVDGFNYLQREIIPNEQKRKSELSDEKNNGTKMSTIKRMTSGNHGLNFTRSNYLSNEENPNNFSPELIPDNAKITRVVEVDGLVFIANDKNNYIFVSRKGGSTLRALCVIDTGLTQNDNLNIGGYKANSFYHYVWFTYYNKCVNEQALVVIKRPAQMFRWTNKDINLKMYNATEELSHIKQDSHGLALICNYYVQSSSLFGQEVYFGNDWIQIGYKNFQDSEVVRAFKRP